MAQAAAPEATQFLNDDVLGLICRWLEAPDTRRRTERAGLAKAASRTDDCTNSRPLSQETGVWARHDAARSRPRPQAARGTPALAPLVAAARVCRAFNKAATPSIYFLLELDVLDSRQLAKLARTLAPKDAADEAVKARAEELAAMVRHLRVRNAGSASSEVLRIVRAVAPHLFALDLSRARLRGWPLHRAPPILEAFPEQGAQLRALNLTLADWDYNERGASKILKLVTERFPNLEFLSLDNCGPVSGTSIVRVMTALPRLKDFKFGSRHLLFSAKQWLALQKAMLAKHSTAADYLEWTEAHKFAHIDFSMESISDRDFREFDPWSLAVLIAATFPNLETLRVSGLQLHDLHSLPSKIFTPLESHPGYVDLAGDLPERRIAALSKQGIICLAELAQAAIQYKRELETSGHGEDTHDPFAGAGGVHTHNIGPFELPPFMQAYLGQALNSMLGQQGGAAGAVPLMIPVQLPGDGLEFDQGVPVLGPAMIDQLSQGLANVLLGGGLGAGMMGMGGTHHHHYADDEASEEESDMDDDDLPPLEDDGSDGMGFPPSLEDIDSDSDSDDDEGPPFSYSSATAAPAYGNYVTNPLVPEDDDMVPGLSGIDSDEDSEGNNGFPPPLENIDSASDPSDEGDDFDGASIDGLSDDEDVPAAHSSLPVVPQRNAVPTQPSVSIPQSSNVPKPKLEAPPANGGNASYRTTVEDVSEDDDFFSADDESGSVADDSEDDEFVEDHDEPRKPGDGARTEIRVAQTRPTPPPAQTQKAQANVGPSSASLSEPVATATPSAPVAAPAGVTELAGGKRGGKAARPAPADGDGDALPPLEDIYSASDSDSDAAPSPAKPKPAPAKAATPTPPPASQAKAAPATAGKAAAQPAKAATAPAGKAGAVPAAAKGASPVPPGKPAAAASAKQTKAKPAPASDDDLPPDLEDIDSDEGSDSDGDAQAKPAGPAPKATASQARASPSPAPAKQAPVPFDPTAATPAPQEPTVGSFTPFAAAAASNPGIEFVEVEMFLPDPPPAPPLAPEDVEDLPPIREKGDELIVPKPPAPAPQPQAQAQSSIPKQPAAGPHPDWDDENDEDYSDEYDDDDEDEDEDEYEDESEEGDLPPDLEDIDSDSASED